MDFEPFPKIPRLNRDITVTEKLDGTNAAVLIESALAPGGTPTGPDEIVVDGVLHRVQAQSRKRIITPGKTTDNYGFAGWVRDNAEELVRLLGPGRHYGEWWGQGIQHGYGLDARRFSLFNPARYPHIVEANSHPESGEPLVRVVPVLYEGPFGTAPIGDALNHLREAGSVAAPGWMRPEGIIVFHTAARVLFKVTLENDEKPKEVVARETAKVAANGGGSVASIHWGEDGV